MAGILFQTISQGTKQGKVFQKDFLPSLNNIAHFFYDQSRITE